MYGNLDKEGSHEFSANWAECVVIRESQFAKVGDGVADSVEIPSSVKIKPFNKTLFNLHVNQGMFNKLSVQILHDPR